MPVETMVLPEEDPYQGLRELAIKVMHLVLRRLAQIQAWRKIIPIRGGTPSIWGDISNFLSGILAWFNWEGLQANIRWRIIEPLGSWLREHIFDPIKGVITAIKDRFLAIFDWEGLGSFFRWRVIEPLGAWLREHIFNPLKDVITAIKDRFLAWFDWESWGTNIRWRVIEPLGAWLREHLFNPLKDVITAIKDRFLAFFDWEGLGSFFRWRVIEPLGAWFREHIFDPIKRAIEAFKTFLGDPLEGLRQLWARFQETWAGQLLSSLISGFSAFWNTIITALRQLWARIHPAIVEAAERAITIARPYIERWVGAFKELPATYLNWVAAQAGTNLALHPSTALATAGGLYAMAIAAGSVAMVTSTALNLIPATNWVGASQFSAFIAEAAGFEPLTRATYGTLLNDVLVWPLRYHWNMQLRPKIPTESTIFLMGRKRGLNRAEFGSAMAYHGIPNWWIDKTYTFFWTDPSPYWLLRMSEAANPMIKPSGLFLPWLEEWLPGWRSDPWAWYKMKLMLAGFEDTDIPAFIEGFQARYIKTAITQVETSVRAMLREAYWSRAEAEGALRPLKVRQDKIELLIVAEELDYQKRFLDDEVRYFNEAFRKGELDLQDLTLALSTIIVKGERVAQIVARERVRALKKPKPITEPKEDPLVTSLRRQAITSWTKQYRNWLIDEEDLLLGLTIVTENPDLAAEMVAVERTRYRPVPVPPPPPPEDPIVAKSRRQAIASWVTAFRKGEIDAGELELYLEPLIPDRETRLQIVHLESLRYTPTPELIPPPKEDPDIARIRAERVRGHIAMFLKRLIGLEQLYSFLLGDGLVEPLARATVITQANKRIRVPPIDSPYFLKDIIQEAIDKGLLAYEEMFMKAQITIDQYTAWLTAIGVDPDVVTYLADTLTLRRFLEGL